MFLMLEIHCSALFSLPLKLCLFNTNYYQQKAGVKERLADISHNIYLLHWVCPILYKQLVVSPMVYFSLSLWESEANVSVVSTAVCTWKM